MAVTADALIELVKSQRNAALDALALATATVHDLERRLAEKSAPQDGAPRPAAEVKAAMVAAAEAARND